jgi:hypothetical protein
MQEALKRNPVSEATGPLPSEETRGGVDANADEFSRSLAWSTRWWGQFGRQSDRGEALARKREQLAQAREKNEHKKVTRRPES